MSDTSNVPTQPSPKAPQEREAISAKEIDLILHRKGWVVRMVSDGEVVEPKEIAAAPKRKERES